MLDVFPSAAIKSDRLFPDSATLTALDTQGTLSVAAVQPEAIIDRWLFPLFSLDLSKIPVDVDALRSTRDDYWYREMGV